MDKSADERTNVEKALDTIDDRVANGEKVDKQELVDAMEAVVQSSVPTSEGVGTPGHTPQELPRFRIWALACPFKKDGTPSIGSFGKTVRAVYAAIVEASEKPRDRDEEVDANALGQKRKIAGVVSPQVSQPGTDERKERQVSARIPTDPPVDSLTAASDDLGLSVDMLDVDRLREWARLLLVHGTDIGQWGSVPYVAGKMQIIATGVEKAIRDIGTLRAQRDKWLDAFNGSEQFQNGPTKRAEAAEAALAQLRASLRTTMTKWRDAAKRANRLAAEADAINDGANSHAFRKERRVWTTCADYLQALLTANRLDPTP